MAEGEAVDVDSAGVLSVLEGIQSDSRKPDVEIAKIVAELGYGSVDDFALQSTLTSLLRDEF
jgi:hypothetical protein